MVSSFFTNSNVGNFRIVKLVNLENYTTVSIIIDWKYCLLHYVDNTKVDFKFTCYVFIQEN